MSDSRTKRRRLVLACFECKRRKLKCGRETPICRRCIAAGSPHACQYDSRFTMTADIDLNDHSCLEASWSPVDSAGELSSTTTTTTTTTTTNSTADLRNLDPTLIADDYDQDAWSLFPIQLDHLADSPSNILQNNTCIDAAKLDMRHHQQHTMPNPLPPPPPSPAAAASAAVNVQFRGPSHPSSIIGLFPNLRNFMKEIVQRHPVLGSAQWTTTALPPAEQAMPVYAEADMLQSMRRLLPDENRCHGLVELYFTHFAGIYTVFHIPSFWRECKSFWRGTHENPSRFVAMLLALIACSRCLFSEDKLSLSGDSSTARIEAAHWLHAAESWHSHQAGKSAALESISLGCLIQHAKFLNDMDQDSHFTQSQRLLADAISSGIHRDWKVLGEDESIYDQELRQKVWFAVTELEIAACMERGLPSVVPTLFSDMPPPKNCNDCDYNQTTNTEPTDRPDGELTDGSFVRMAQSIKPLRYKIGNLVNDPQAHKALDHTQLAQLRIQVTEMLERVAAWLPLVSGGKEQHTQRVMYRSLLQVYLHELLLLLHLPFALPKNIKVTSSSIDTDYQRFICTRSASAIIKIHDDMRMQGLSPNASGKVHLLRAGLCLCLLEGDILYPGKKCIWRLFFFQSCIFLIPCCLLRLVIPSYMLRES